MILLCPSGDLEKSAGKAAQAKFSFTYCLKKTLAMSITLQFLIIYYARAYKCVIFLRYPS